MTRFFNLTPGMDTFSGQADDDNAFQLTTSTLQSTDTVTGGATGSFIDVVVITAGGAFAGTQFSGVTQIEQLNLSSAGNDVTLTDGLVGDTSIGYFAILDGGGNDTVNASAVTSTPIVLYAIGGADTFRGGAGNDAVVIATADLTSADTLQGGAGIDNLYFSTAGNVAASAFANVSGFEGIGLSSLGNTIALTNALVAGSDNGSFAVADGAGDDIVDGSGVTNGTTLAFFASGGNDTFRGGNGANGYVFTASDLTGGDTVVGGTGGDNLFISTAGTLDASAFSNITGIEGLVLANGTNNVTLTDGLVAGTSVGYFAVAGGTGDDTVDASGVTNGTAIAFFGTNGGNDTFSGGNGNDSFLFGAGQITAGDTVVGGAGNDTLWLTTAGTTTAADLAGVSGIEGAFLQNGGTLALGNGITTAATFAAVGTAATDTFDASAVTGYGVRFAGNGGADVLIGGSQDDTFLIADSAFASIDGNGGNDRITLTAASQSFNLTANASKISDIEAIDLTQSSGASLTLAGSDIPVVSGGGSLYVVGDADDNVSAGSGYTQIASGVVNNSIAPGHSFFEFQHLNGSLLFIDSQIFATMVSSSSDAASVPENVAAGSTVFSGQVSGENSYALGGADAALFNLNAATGDLSFKASPNFESPQDQGHNNVYDVTITASNGSATPELHLVPKTPSQVF